MRGTAQCIRALCEVQRSVSERCAKYSAVYQRLVYACAVYACVMYEGAVHHRRSARYSRVYESIEHESAVRDAAYEKESGAAA